MINYNLQKHFFSNRIIVDVVSADSINKFMNRLVKYWFNQNLKF